MKSGFSRAVWRRFRPTKYDLLRVATLIFIAIILVSHDWMHPSFFPKPGSQVIDLLEILALVAPILWVDSARKLALAVVIMFLTRLAFTSVRCLIKHEYLYSVGFAVVCAVCAISFARGLRRWVSYRGPRDDI